MRKCSILGCDVHLNTSCKAKITRSNGDLEIMKVTKIFCKGRQFLSLIYSWFNIVGYSYFFRINWKEVPFTSQSVNQRNFGWMKGFWSHWILSQFFLYTVCCVSCVQWRFLYIHRVIEIFGMLLLRRHNSIWLTTLKLLRKKLKNFISGSIRSTIFP